MTTHDPSEQAGSLDLLRLACRGVGGAFDELYRRHRDELLLAVRAGMGPGLRAAIQTEDVLQSVAMEAFELLRRGAEPPHTGFRGLLRRIVRHRLVDKARALRRQKRAGTVPLSLAEHVATPVPPSYSDARYERLERALLALPAEQSEVLQMRRFDGLSSQEIAARTGRTDDAVRKLMSRAMARLGMLLEVRP